MGLHSRLRRETVHETIIAQTATSSSRCAKGVLPNTKYQ
jgi:hypothetical protein